MRGNRWETYCDGRRPAKGPLVASIVVEIMKHGEEECQDVNMGRDELEKALSGLPIPVLACLDGALTRLARNA